MDDFSSPSSPYTARMVTFLVSGYPISISEDYILKYPYSKLADIASYSLPGETASISWPVEDFNALLEYLKTDKIDESDQSKLERLLKTFEYFQIPIPDHLRFKQMQAASRIAPVETSSALRSINNESGLPNYDSVSSSSTFQAPLGLGKLQAEPLTIQQKISLAVEDRLTNLLMEHILPLVEGQATSGIYNGAFILVPSNSATLQKPSDAVLSLYDGGTPTEQPDEQVISLSLSNIALFKYIKLVRLQGAQNNVQFLTQRQVIDELKGQLKARLQLPDPPPPPPVIVEPASPPPQAKKSKWGWGKSYVLGPDPGVPVAPIIPPPAPRGPLDIRIEEVSMRRMNHMGLYETATGTVLVVEIILS